MAVITLGNAHVIEVFKKDDGLEPTPDNIEIVDRADLGQQVCTMNLNEVDGDDRPSRAMNLNCVVRMWPFQSDQPPAWVDGDDELLVALVAEHFECPAGRPKNWQEGLASAEEPDGT